jgi:WD40 repeat protein
MVINKSQPEIIPVNTSISPFKMWDSYQKDDKDIFFGRGRESQLLYEKTFTSNLLLLYGASGTGKTSLIQCGLGNKFEESDWLPIFVRKGENIIRSLSAALQENAAHPENLKNNPIREKIHQLFLEQFRPVYLIFDQFEELFIQGSKQEQDSFFTLLPELLANNFQCKIIISIREDYLAYLDEYEDYVPSLFYNRQRLERMRTEQIEEVLRGTSTKLDIQLGNASGENEQELIDRIIENVENDLGKLDLADLQVYLDQLYKRDQVRKAEANDPERPTQFDTDLVKDTGDLEDVLGVLLAHELVSLEHELEERGAAPRGIPKSVLAELVTTEGTKLNMQISRIKQILKERENIDPKHIEYCINHLIEIRILKDQKKNSGKTVEIAHDRLAKKIYSLIGGEKQKEKEIVQEIQNAFTSYKKRGSLLSEEDLNYLQPYLEKLVLSTEQQAFLRLSKRQARKKDIRQKMIMLGVIAVLASSMILALWQWYQSRQLSRANNLSAAALHASAFDRTQAYNLAKKALTIVEDHQLAGSVLNDMLLNSNIFPFYADVRRSDKIEKFSDMAVSDDERFLAAGSQDGKLLFYHLNSENKSSWDTVYAAHEGLITDVDFTRTNGKNILLTSGWDGKVQVWTTQGDFLLQETTFDHDGEPVLMFTRKDDLLITATKDKIWEWNFATKKESDNTPDVNLFEVAGVRRFNLARVTSFEYVKTEEQRFLLAASRDSMLTLKNIDQNSKTDIHFSMKYGVIENMDLWYVDEGNVKWLLAAGLENGKMMITPLPADFFTAPKAGRQAEYFEENSLFIEAHTDAIKDVSFIDQEAERITILSSSRDKTAKLWTYMPGGTDPVKDIALQKSFLGHNDGLRAISHVKAGREKYIIFTGGEDRTIKKWVVAPYPSQILGAATYGYHDFVHSASGKRILTIDKLQHDVDGLLSLFRYGQTFAGDFEAGDISQVRQNEEKLSRAVFSMTGDTILFPCKTEEGKAYVISAAETDTSRIDLSKFEKVLGVHQGSDGAKALVLHGGHLLLLDLMGKYEIDGIQHKYPADQAYFSSDGKFIVITAKEENGIYWWQSGTSMKQTESLSYHTDEVLSVAISPDDKYILTGSKDNRFMLYERRKDGRPERIGSITRHSDNVNSVDFSADGSRFLTASEDGTVRIWNMEALTDKSGFFDFWRSDQAGLEQLKEEKSYINLGKPIVKAAFLSNEGDDADKGVRIMTLDKDGVIRIWRTDFIESKTFFEKNIYPMDKTYKDYQEVQ